MILDLSSLGGMIHVTSQLTNAMLVAMLPQVTDVAQKLDLPVQLPITQERVLGSCPVPYVDSYGEIPTWFVRLKEGCWLGFAYGSFCSFESPHSYYALQNPDEIPKYVGECHITQGEAIKMARDALTKLGIPLEYVFAEQEPKVDPPHQTSFGLVPHYLIEWLEPYSSGAAVKIEVNGGKKRIEWIDIFLNENLRRPWPDFGVKPELRSSYSNKENSAYAEKLVPIVLKAIDDYGEKLKLPIPRPLTTNNVGTFMFGDNMGRPHCVITLTNHWKFIFRHNMVNGYYAPDNLFDFRWKGQRTLIKDYVGKWNLTETQAIQLVAKTLAKLNYPTNLVRMDFAPKISKPGVPGIPRYSIWWWCPNEAHDDLVCKVEAEVDADKGELKSLYFENTAYWGQKPPIDLPLSVPLPPATNPAPVLPPPPKPSLHTNSPSPPFKVLERTIGR